MIWGRGRELIIYEYTSLPRYCLALRSFIDGGGGGRFGVCGA
jgi:hypothetical protein